MHTYFFFHQITTTHVLKRGCARQQRARPGDKVTVHYAQFDGNGSLVTSTDGKEPVTFLLGGGEAPEGWDEALRKMCAGEIIDLVVSSEDEVKTYRMTVEVITRTVKKSPQRNGKGILLRREGRCRDAKLIKEGDTVTLQTVIRIPNCKEIEIYSYLV